MNKKVKSILIAGAVFATAAALAIGGSLAYLVDTDENINVMTLGNIEIDQIEQERVDYTDNQTALQDYTQDKPLYPTYYEGSSIPWAPADEWVTADDQAWKVVADNANVVDKFVTVDNTGDNAAYVRTIFAIEVGENALADPYIHLVTNGTNIKEGATWEWEWINDDAGETAIVEINGGYYMIYVATYTEALPAGETTIPSLKQVYMGKEAGNEEVASLGDDYKIYAYTQAVQSDSFTGSGLTVKGALDEAFYTVTAAEHPWLNRWDGSVDTAWYDADPTAAEFTISTPSELAGLAQIVNNGNDMKHKTITLAADIDLANLDWTPIGIYGSTFKGAFDGAGYTISNLKVTDTVDNNNGVALFGNIFGGGDYPGAATVKNVTVDGATIVAENYGAAIVGHNYGTVTGCTAKNVTITVGDKGGAIVGWTSNESLTTISGNTASIVTITADRDAGAIVGFATSKAVLSENTWTNVTVQWSGEGTGANISNGEVGRTK